MTAARIRDTVPWYTNMPLHSDAEYAQDGVRIGLRDPNAMAGDPARRRHGRKQSEAGPAVEGKSVPS